MKVIATYPDDSQTVMYEVGDRVRILKVPPQDLWFVKPGEIATVRRCGDKKQTSISFLEVQTDKHVQGGWGVWTAAPWDLELANE